MRAEPRADRDRRPARPLQPDRAPARDRDDRRPGRRRGRAVRRLRDHRHADGRLERAGVRGGVRARRHRSPSAWPARAPPPSRRRGSSWSSIPYDDADFEELVRDALDDLPDLLRTALERNVAVVISDGGTQAPRLRPLPRRRRHARRLPRPHHHLPRHAAPRLRPRRGPAARAGDDHGPPRARPPHRVRRARRPRPRSCDVAGWASSRDR